jgi:outer membrane protein assembly factor BamC
MFLSQQFRRAAALALGAAVFSLVLASCSSVNNLDFGKRIDYKSAQTSPALQVPPDLSSPQVDDRYVVNSANALAHRDLRAEARNKQVLPDVSGVSLQRAGSERWLVVHDTPAKVWETVRQFWIDTGFVIAKENPMIGTMETDWAENRADIPQDFVSKALGKTLDSLFYSTDKRDKFFTRIEKGVEPGTVEIYIAHRGMEEMPTVYEQGAPAAFAWGLLPPDPNLEAEMLMRLMVRFGAEKAQAIQEIKAVQHPTPAMEHARIVKQPNGTQALEVDDDFDRAWRRVGLALDRVGFTVTDRDRAKGIYYVRYADPEVDLSKTSNGFFSKLAFWNKGPKVVPKDYNVTLTQGANQKTLVSVTPSSVVTSKDDKTPATPKVLSDKDMQGILELLKGQLD